MTTTPERSGPHWLRIVPGLVLLGVTAFVTVSAWDALLANNLAYPLSLAACLVLALWLVASGFLRRRPLPSGFARGLIRAFAAIGIVLIAGLMWWLMPLVAAPVAIDALESTEQVTVTESRSRMTFEPAVEPTAGLVLYPGGKVDPRSYANLARQVAEQGYLVVVPKCPYDLAMTCINAAADHVSDSMPWAVGGHSLGGVVASSYIAEDETAQGLVFWASYPLPDLSERDDVQATSIYGTEDKLTEPSDISRTQEKLPPETRTVPITGAVHAFFGDYGEQPGDGEPTIERDVAQEQIVQATVVALESLADTAS